MLPDFDKLQAEQVMKHQMFLPYSSEHEKEFMTRKCDPIILKYSRLMHIRAPKICDKCSKPLDVPELCWREEKNIANFLCYKCIGILEKEEAMLEQDGVGRWILKKITNE